MTLHEINPESFYSGLSEDYDSELNERSESIKECELCNGKGFDETISDCCGFNRDANTGICLYCKEHSDPSKCPECENGIIK